MILPTVILPPLVDGKMTRGEIIPALKPAFQALRVTGKGARPTLAASWQAIRLDKR